MENEPNSIQETGSDNPFAAYGRGATSRNIGELLKFQHGTYVAGPAGDDVAPGTVVIPCMDLLTIGWTKWEDARPVEHRTELCVDGIQPPRRRELGDLDEALWERGDNGKPRDPWSFGNSLPMIGADDRTIYTFVTSSLGGLNAIGELCKTYGKALRQRPDAYPVVELASGSYQHRDKSIGKVRFPVFRVLDYTPKAPILQLIAETRQEDMEPDEPRVLPPAKVPRPQKKRA